MRSLTRVLLASALVTLVASSAAAQSAYLFVPDIPGDSTAVGREGWIELLSLSHGASGGRSSGCDVHVNKGFDTTGPALYFAAVTGSRFPEVKVEFAKVVGEGKEITIYQIKLLDARVLAVQTSAAAGGGNPTEAVSFSGANMTLTVWAQKADGSIGAAESKTISCK